MRTYLSLDGILSHFSNNNSDLFSDITLPAGIDKETLVNTIYQRGGEFGVIYSDPDFLKRSITSWFNTYYDTFSKWLAVLSEDYSPLENYDRKEDWTDNGTGESHNSIKQNDETGTETKVSAFNSSSYEPSSDVTAIGESSSKADGNSASKNIHNGRIHGNIGVMTSQEMLQYEMKVRKEYNIYSLISDMFCDEYLIKVY